MLLRPDPVLVGPSPIGRPRRNPPLSGSASPLHTATTTAAIPAAVLGSDPVVLARIGSVWVSGLVHGPWAHPVSATKTTPETPMFFTFPEDARWNADRQALEFGVEIGEYQGVVRVPRRVFQRRVPEPPTPIGYMCGQHRRLRVAFETVGTHLSEWK
jgi:hypothetical protein